MSNQKGLGVFAGLLIVVIVAVLGFAGWYVWQKNDDKDTKSNTPSSATTPATENKQEASFANPKKSAHFESSTPAHATTLAAVPVDVVIDFNFDLASNSTIQINKDSKDYGIDNTKVDTNKLAMRRQMDAGAPNGIYSVNYKGCWPDKTCHDGSFQFAIDRSLLSSYEDGRNQKAITIKLSNIKFQPVNLRISSGTTVTWVNDDMEEHYVNTDSHPAHTHVPTFNSKALTKGQSYSFTFTNLGAYPYHCSAHATQMTANIVVE